MAKDTKSIDPVYGYIGSRLRDLRVERSLTQSQVAKIIEVSPAQYYKYEEGLSKCSITNLYSLARHFSVDISSILPVAAEDYGDLSSGEGVNGATNITSEDATIIRNSKLSVVANNSVKAPSSPPLADSELLAELISSFMQLPTQASRANLVRFLKSL